MILERFPLVNRQAGGTGTVNSVWGSFENYKVNAAIIDKCEGKLTVKVKGKAGEDGTAEYIPFRYKKADGSLAEYTAAPAEGVELSANYGAILAVVTADRLAKKEFDWIAFELSADGNGEIGTLYFLQTQPRYTNNE
jgi:hypothetical protein